MFECDKEMTPEMYYFFFIKIQATLFLCEVKWTTPCHAFNNVSVSPKDKIKLLL